MTSIVKAKEEDFQLLAELGKMSFIESHGTSASTQEINKYLNEKYAYQSLRNEINDPVNIFYIIYYNQKPAGYSKIIFNEKHSNIPMENLCKLDRIYLLKEFYNLKLGLELFNFNMELSKKNNQSGMWLFVWKENHRAVNFYKRAGFKIRGSYDFKLTETHSNPNHQMVLIY